MSTQKFDDAQGPAICIVFHIFLCSSSLWDPRHRLPKGVIDRALSREDGHSVHSFSLGADNLINGQPSKEPATDMTILVFVYAVYQHLETILLSFDSKIWMV